MTFHIITGNCFDVLRELDAESVHCVVSSPPYWGLRDYGIPPTVWGGDADCDHEWYGEVTVRAADSAPSSSSTLKGNGHSGGGPKLHRDRGSSVHGSCMRCGAWRGNFGLEPTPELFIDHLVLIFEEVRRVLRKDGTLWLNLGDSYYSPRYNGGVGESSTINGQDAQEEYRKARKRRVANSKTIEAADFVSPHRAVAIPGLKAKDLVGVPWMAAFALRRAGWYLRRDHIWFKPNPMPESTPDRCTTSHEYLFHLSKSEHYYFDQEAIKEDASDNSHPRKANGAAAPMVSPKSVEHGRGIKANESFHAAGGDLVTKRNKRSVWTVDEEAQVDFLGTVEKVPRPPWGRKSAEKGSFKGKRATEQQSAIDPHPSFRAIRETRNKRSVWTVATQPFAEAHFATFPPALIEPCILAGTSARGCCPICMTGWDRITAPTERYAALLGRGFNDHEEDESAGMMQSRGLNRQNAMMEAGMTCKETETIGWYPSCKCAGVPKLPKYPRAPSTKGLDEAARESRLAPWRAECARITAERRALCKAVEKMATKRAVVLDPFGGAGTTALVADRLQRDSLLIELNTEYAEMARKRIVGDAPLFAVAAE